MLVLGELVPGFRSDLLDGGSIPRTYQATKKKKKLLDVSNR